MVITGAVAQNSQHMGRASKVAQLAYFQSWLAWMSLGCVRCTKAEDNHVPEALHFRVNQQAKLMVRPLSRSSASFRPYFVHFLKPSKRR